MLLYHTRWIGNAIVPAVGLIALIWWYAKTKPRPPSLSGALVGLVIGISLFAGVFAYALWFRTPPPNEWFPPPVIFIWISAYPLQWIGWLIFGNDSFVDEDLLIPTALMSWALVGAGIGAVGRGCVDWLRRSGFSRESTIFRDSSRLKPLLRIRMDARRPSVAAALRDTAAACR